MLVGGQFCPSGRTCWRTNDSRIDEKERALSSEPSQDQNPQASRRRLLTGMGAAAAGAGVLAVAGTQTASAVVDAGTYFSVPPERLVDTRVEGGRIRVTQTRTDDIIAGTGIAAVCNVTVVNTAGAGFLAVFNADEPRPDPYSTVNWYAARQIVANIAIIELGDAGFSVYCGGGSTDYIIDLVGYFETSPVAERSPRGRTFEESLRRKLRQRR